MNCAPFVLKILDKRFAVSLDCEALRVVVKKMYGRFLCNGPPQETDHHLKLSLTDFQPEHEQALPGREANEQALIFMLAEIVNTIAIHIRTHLLLHAGVLSYRGQGIVIVGESMHGKTTLVLELLRRGFDFLSDDVAAVGRSDGMVYPFPRSLVVRAGSLQMAGFSALSLASLPVTSPLVTYPSLTEVTWLGKTIIDAEKLRPGCIGKPVPIWHLLFLTRAGGEDLHSGQTPSPIKPENSNPFWLTISHLPSQLGWNIEQLEGVESLLIEGRNQFPTIKIVAQNRSRTLQQIESLCHSHGVRILLTRYQPSHKPNFFGPVRLKGLSASDAMPRLLPHFLGGYHSTLLRDELQDSPAQLLLLLMSLLRGVEISSLSIGPLHQAADAICELVD